MSLFPLLSNFQARPLLAAKLGQEKVAKTSLDLNQSKVEVELLEEGVKIPDGWVVKWDQIEEIASEERRVYALQEEGIRAIQIFSEETNWVRTLCPTAAGPPTTLVSGIPMHRIKDTDPAKDTESKMKALGRVQGSVLDTATGLGYTAIQAAKFASRVVTIELDSAAIELARFNPWSQELFTSPKIVQVIGDAFEEILQFSPGSFAGIIHDPPTMSLGGELYSQEFYSRMFSMLGKQGRLFHYVGDPSSHVGSKAYPGIVKRLKLAGFKRVDVAPEAHGVSATKS